MNWLHWHHWTESMRGYGELPKNNHDPEYLEGTVMVCACGTLGFKADGLERIVEI